MPFFFFCFLFWSCNAADLIHEAAPRRSDHLKFIDAAATDQMRSRNLPFVFHWIVLPLSLRIVWAICRWCESAEARRDNHDRKREWRRDDGGKWICSKSKWSNVPPWWGTRFWHLIKSRMVWKCIIYALLLQIWPSVSAAYRRLNVNRQNLATRSGSLIIMGQDQVVSLQCCLQRVWFCCALVSAIVWAFSWN